MKWIAHIDLNCFFARAEVIRDPSLSGLPIAVGGNGRRSVISTASYEARKFGVHSAMPTSMAKLKCPQLIIVNGHYDLYEQLSNQFFSFVSNYSKIIEIASIDECYLDLTEQLKNATNIKDFLFDMQTELFLKTQLKCSIGLAHTKFLAKMASDIKKPLGITIIDNGDIEYFLYDLEIEEFYGIGKKTSERLRKNNINTIRDFVNSSEVEIKKICGNQYDHYMDCIHGNSNDIVDNSPFNPKSLSAERTFLYDTNIIEEINAVLKEECKDVIGRVNYYKKQSKSVSVVFRNSDFITYSKSIKTADFITTFEGLYKAVSNIMNNYYDEVPLRLIGVSMNNLVDIREDEYVQMNIFGTDKDEKIIEREQLINTVNNKIGTTKLTTLGRKKRNIHEI